METQGATEQRDDEERLRREVVRIAAGYPAASYPDPDLDTARPIDRLLAALVRGLGQEPNFARAARRLGADLRRRHGPAVAAAGDAEQPSGDVRRGLALVAVEELHGADPTELVAGDRLTAGQVAVYVADEWWPGRDDLPVEEWADLRRVRARLALDALDLPAGERGDALGFAAGFVGRHPDLVREAAWGLCVVGSCKGFDPEVWVATGDDALLRGVHFLAERVLADLGDGTTARRPSTTDRGGEGIPRP